MSRRVVRSQQQQRAWRSYRSWNPPSRCPSRRQGPPPPARKPRAFRRATPS